jgi:hypothetical protein
MTESHAALIAEISAHRKKERKLRLLAEAWKKDANTPDARWFPTEEAADAVLQILGGSA